MSNWSPRHDIALKRIRNILARYTVATMRMLEQKISDAGPFNQRIDPHILTEARNALSQKGVIQTRHLSSLPWYYLANVDQALLTKRLHELDALHRQTAKKDFSNLLGQALEIATFKALKGQTELVFFGNYPDLDAHEDNKMYRKEEPPSSLSGNQIPGGKQLDFLVHHKTAGYAGLEMKNIREWIYPDRDEIRELLAKCCALDVVPVLIARRIHFSTFSVLNPCGVLMHQTYNQLYPNSEKALAEKVSDKNLLGYHDVRVGNDPDDRLITFIGTHLPNLIPEARDKFDQFKDLLCDYGIGEINYPAFAAASGKRRRGESEDLDELDGNDYEGYE